MLLEEVLEFDLTLLTKIGGFNMHTAFLIPNNTLVRDPITKEPLPAGGKMLSLLGSEGRYWRRRIRDGSVIISGPHKKPVIPKVEKTETRKRGKNEEG